MEFLVAASARPVLLDQLMTVSGWQLAVEEEDDFLRATFTRLPPG